MNAKCSSSDERTISLTTGRIDLSSVREDGPNVDAPVQRLFLALDGHCGQGGGHGRPAAVGGEPGDRVPGEDIDQVSVGMNCYL